MCVKYQCCGCALLGHSAPGTGLFDQCHISVYLLGGEEGMWRLLQVYRYQLSGVPNP